MKTTMETVSAFEAKTHLSELLKKVQNGELFIVTLRGKPIARIVPFSDKNNYNSENAIDSLRKIRNSIKSKVNIREMIEEGRR